MFYVIKVESPEQVYNVESTLYRAKFLFDGNGEYKNTGSINKYVFRHHTERFRTRKYPIYIGFKTVHYSEWGIMVWEQTIDRLTAYMKSTEYIRISYYRIISDITIIPGIRNIEL